MVISEEFTSKLKHIGVDDIFMQSLGITYHEFCKQIMMDLTFFDDKPENYGFSCLGLISKEYLVQKYFEERVETHIREILFTRFFEENLERRGYTVNTPQYVLRDDEYTDGDIIKTNRDFEKRAGFELIINDQNKRIGCRFTDIYSFEANEILAKGFVTDIVIIDWNNTNGINENDKQKRTYKIDGSVDIQGIGEFAKYWLGEKEGEAYVCFLHEAIKNYQEIIGISSLPRLSAPMLFEHRIEKENVLKTEIWNALLEASTSKEEKHFGYKLVNPGIFNDRQADYKDNIETRSEDFLINSTAYNSYINQKMYRSLIGRGDFAKSFLTSEYLFTQYDKSDQFDYTSIVSGYIKSIEQLLYKYVFHWFNKRLPSDSTKYFEIQKRNARRGVNIEFNNNNKDKFDTSLGSLIYFISNNRSDLLNIDNEQHKKTVIDCLFCYLIECRNDSFHKDNNYNWGVVEKIRHNTLFLYIALLGSLNVRRDTQANEVYRIVPDDRLERIYYSLRKDGIYNFRVKLFNDSAFYLATRHPEDKFPEFDNYGFLKDDFSIFIRCEDESNNKNSISYFITRDSIPEKVWIKKTIIDDWHLVNLE